MVGLSSYLLPYSLCLLSVLLLLLCHDCLISVLRCVAVFHSYLSRPIKAPYSRCHCGAMPIPQFSPQNPKLSQANTQPAPGKPQKCQAVTYLSQCQQLHTTAPGRREAGSSEEVFKYILKRIFTERGARTRLAGLREAYFGRLLQNSTSVLQVQFCCPRYNHH